MMSSGITRSWVPMGTIARCDAVGRGGEREPAAAREGAQHDVRHARTCRRPARSSPAARARALRAARSPAGGSGRGSRRASPIAARPSSTEPETTRCSPAAQLAGASARRPRRRAACAGAAGARRRDRRARRRASTSSLPVASRWPMAATSWEPTCQTLRPWPSGVQEVDVRAGVAGRVRPGEFLDGDALGARHASVEPRARQTNTVPGVRSRARGCRGRKSLLAAGERHLDARRERARVHGGHEDRLRHRVGRRHAAEGPRAEGGPQAGLEQQRAQPRAVALGAARRVPAREGDLRVRAVVGGDVDHQGDEARACRRGGSRTTRPAAGAV